ncbi:hypothetical protein [Brevibacillus centrosporus]|uniref:hypothetical protein n=1 Tax=Brevibacillus centrosporus TaxID=54910 RepID=UPI003B01B866
MTEMVDWQWFLFLPSMYAFAIYQAYTSVNESNTLYDIEQIRFLRARAEKLAHLHKAENDSVEQVIATFEHSPFVEIVIHDMEKLGVPSQNIVALPLENLESQTHIIDSIHRVDGKSVGWSHDGGNELWGAWSHLWICLVLGTHYLGAAWFSREVLLEVTCPAAMQESLIKLLKSRRANGFVIVPQRFT